jgi:class 3 adenylate cyclase
MHGFFALIDRLIRATPEQKPAVEQLIWDTFGVEMAILCLDMSNFSLSVRRAGILSYLCKVHLMRRTCRPVVELYGGHIVKQEADNLMCVFDRCDDAVNTAVAINRELRKANLATPDDQDVTVSIGIAHGKFLLVPETDCYGDPVNAAFKLGEDLAESGEVLVSAEVVKQLPQPAPFELQAVEFSLSGVPLPAFRVGYK